MQQAPNPTVPRQAQELLARWRSSWLPRRAPEPCNEDWGVESALPWLQSQASPPQQL